MKRLLIFLAILCSGMGAMAQRTTDILDRGLVAVPSGSGAFVSWRIFAEEYYDVEYNLYRNGVKLNPTPLKVSNYTDTGGTAGAKYQVAAVVRGVEQEKCEAVARLNQQYIQFAVGKLYSRRGTDITASYNINDIEVVKGIYYYLKKKGVRVYLDCIVDPDMKRNETDKQTAERIHKRLMNSNSLLYAQSPSAATSNWMPWEIGLC